MTDPPAERSSEPNESSGHPGPAAESAGSRLGAGGDPPTVRSGSSLLRRAQQSVPALPVPGDRLGSFVIEESIGAGGMGAVYRAMDLRLDRHVALKLLPPDQALDAEVVQRFYQEGRAAARLDHENIARVYSIGQDGAYHHIAFEYIEGTTIRQRVAERGPLSIGESINFTLQLASALVHAAERGVVHRDIKPSNIIVTPQGRAKLVDMGLARHFERGVSTDDGLTQSGMTLGTFDYISPEQARDPRDVDVRSDLYSLGCTLFHMLTGRPPFPEGTVLQKLLQHQEEPAPNVRDLNPSVPEDLAGVLNKLMAKDRDRRYQTPEQLVRDLLTLAGTLGLRSVSPEGLVWMTSVPARSWERHLVWALPGAALAAFVGAIIWMSRPEEPTTPPLAYDRPDIGLPAPPGPVMGAATVPTPNLEGPPAVVASEPAPPSAVPREYALRFGDDLARVLESAPSGSTITLLDNGPFDLPWRPVRPVGAAAQRPRDLVVRAAPKARPVLRPVRSVSDPAGESSQLGLGPGRVVLEGLEFLLDPGDGGATQSAIVADGTDLTVRRCLFRMTGLRTSPGRRAAIHLRTPFEAQRPGDRPAPAVIEESFFDQGQIAIWAQGPADVQVRDCAFGPAAPTIWLDNSAAPAFVNARLWLRHISVLADDGPVLRLARTAATIRLDDSVVAPPREGATTLIMTDAPDRIDWLGRSNLYARIDTYLLPSFDLLSATAIRRFDLWAEDALVVREIGSEATEAAVWSSDGPIRALTQANPLVGFQVEPSELPAIDTGARRGPFGPLATSPELLALAPKPPAEPRLAPLAPDTAKPFGEVPEEPVKAASGPMVRSTDMMPPVPGTVPDAPTAPRNDPPAGPRPGVRGPGPGAVVARPNAQPREEPEEGPAPLRGSAELLAVLRRPEAPLEPIRLAAGVEYTLPPSELRGEGRWTLTGPDEPNGARPVLRLAADPLDFPDALERTALFQITAGHLALRNVDVVVDALEPAAERRLAIFTLQPGTDLSLEHCVITLRGSPPRSSLVAMLAPAQGLAPGQTVPTTSFEAVDCLLRSGGDLIEVAGGARADLEFNNCVVGTSGSLLRALGSAQAADTNGPVVKLSLRQVAARMAGGMVLLSSDELNPALPLAEVTARDCLLATTSNGAPLFRVDGQEGLDMLRDRLRWEGHGVAYHQIEVYRRDQSSQPGTVPLHFERPDWEVAVARHEESPFHGELRFVNEWDDSQPLWSIVPEDFRLDPRGPGRNALPDLSRVPTPAPTKRD